MIAGRWGRLLAVVLVALGLWAPEALARRRARRHRRLPPCAASLDVCPEEGCAPPGTPEAYLNRLKRRYPVGPTYAPLVLDDFEALQTAADKRVGQEHELEPEDRNLLKRMKVSRGRVDEGEPVEVTGYVVGAVHDNKSGESVNCRLKGIANNDIHITLARRSDDSPFQGVVAEMIPQKRPDGWTLPRLRRVEEKGIPVLVQGQLLYDNPHRVNRDTENAIPGQPPRLSLWEVHPVTAFFVCRDPSRGCDPRNKALWTPIESY